MFNKIPSELGSHHIILQKKNNFYENGLDLTVNSEHINLLQAINEKTVLKSFSNHKMDLLQNQKIQQKQQHLLQNIEKSLKEFIDIQKKDQNPTLNFALNPYINLKGSIQSKKILENHIPCFFNEEKSGQITNFEQEVRRIKFKEKNERQQKRKLKELKNQIGKFDQFMNKQGKNLEALKTEISNQELEERQNSIENSNLFSDNYNDTAPFCSPEKQPVLRLADPLYKPFKQRKLRKRNTSSSSSSYTSHISEEDYKSVKSEDDSPIKIQMLRSPNKKIKQQKEYQNKIDQLLKESDQIDNQIKLQIQQIQINRQQTQDVYKSSEQVIENYNLAYKQIDERIQQKKNQIYGGYNSMINIQLKDKKMQNQKQQEDKQDEQNDIWLVLQDEKKKIKNNLNNQNITSKTSNQQTLINFQDNQNKIQIPQLRIKYQNQTQKKLQVENPNKLKLAKIKPKLLNQWSQQSFKNVKQNQYSKTLSSQKRFVAVNSSGKKYSSRLYQKQQNQQSQSNESRQIHNNKSQESVKIEKSEMNIRIKKKTNVGIDLQADKNQKEFNSALNDYKIRQKRIIFPLLGDKKTRNDQNFEIRNVCLPEVRRDSSLVLVSKDNQCTEDCQDEDILFKNNSTQKFILHQQDNIEKETYRQYLKKFESQNKIIQKLHNSNSLDNKIKKYCDQNNGNPYCIDQLENKLLIDGPKLQNENLIGRNIYHTNKYNIQIKPLLSSSFSSKNLNFDNQNYFKQVIVGPKLTYKKSCDNFDILNSFSQQKGLKGNKIIGNKNKILSSSLCPKTLGLLDYNKYSDQVKLIIRNSQKLNFTNNQKKLKMMGIQQQRIKDIIGYNLPAHTQSFESIGLQKY